MVSLRLCLVGKGYWGSVYARELVELGVDFRHMGRDWDCAADGLIIASSTASHYEIAHKALSRGVPVLVEKPVATTASEARKLVSLGGIAYAGHTRLYDPSWPEFRAYGTPSQVEAWAGGINAGNPDAFLNWATHLGSMCFDLGFDPRRAKFHITEEKQPLRFVADGREFRDSRGGLANLIAAFIRAIERGEPDNYGLRMGVKTLEFVEEMKCL